MIKMKMFLMEMIYLTIVYIFILMHFMEIKNIRQGNRYEVVQSNKGHYLTTEELITAEIIVTMKNNKYNMAYLFDKEQKISMFKQPNK
jgi:hypothetical protein